MLGLACGCVMLAALLSPAAQLDIDAYAREAARYGQAAARGGGACEGGGGRARARSHRARERGIYNGQGGRAGPNRYTYSWSADGFWYPWECSVAAENSAALSDAIEGELGIPPERQSWGVEA